MSNRRKSEEWIYVEGEKQRDTLTAFTLCVKVSLGTDEYGLEIMLDLGLATENRSCFGQSALGHKSTSIWRLPLFILLITGVTEHHLRYFPRVLFPYLFQALPSVLLHQPAFQVLVCV